MPDITTSEAIKTLMQSPDNASIRSITGPAQDTGWTAPDSAGDKTVQIQTFSVQNFMGSDTVDIGQVISLAEQVSDLTLVVQAMQTSLANRLLPNA